MTLWILVGVLNGKINDVEVFREVEEAVKAQEKMNKNYSFPEIISNDVKLFEREI